MRCEKCGHENAPRASTAERWAPPQDFAAKCEMMLAGALKDHERSFITDIRGRREMTDKQKKWWSAIHKECFGEWPKFDAQTAPAKVEPAALDPNDVPF